MIKREKERVQNPSHKLCPLSRLPLKPRQTFPKNCRKINGIWYFHSKKHSTSNNTNLSYFNILGLCEHCVHARKIMWTFCTCEHCMRIVYMWTLWTYCNLDFSYACVKYCISVLVLTKNCSGNISIVALNQGLYKEGGHWLVDNLHLRREPAKIFFVNLQRWFSVNFQCATDFWWACNFTYCKSIFVCL